MMIDFRKISKEYYLLYKNRQLVSKIPLTKEELYEEIEKLIIKEGEEIFIERFYRSDFEEEGGGKS